MPSFPKALDYVWRAYFRLRRRMPGGFAGPNPVGWQDIDAFVRQSGLSLVPWEVDLIETLDDLYLEAAFASKKTAAPKPQQSAGVIETASMDDPKAVRSLLGSIGRRRMGNKNGDGATTS